MFSAFYLLFCLSPGAAQIDPEKTVVGVWRVDSPARDPSWFTAFFPDGKIAWVHAKNRVWEQGAAGKYQVRGNRIEISGSIATNGHEVVDILILTDTRLVFRDEKQKWTFTRVASMPQNEASQDVGGSQGFQTILAEGYAMSPSAATQLERNLESNADDLNARIALIAFYTSHFEGTDLQSMRAARARHTLWFIEHHPTAEVLGLPVSLINGLGESLDDVDSFRKGKELWDKQIASRPDDIPILEHAALYLMISDKEAAERLILKLIQRNRTYTAWLGKLYGLAVLGVSSIDYRTGRPLTITPENRESDFSKRALSSINVSTDAGVVNSALRAVAEGGRYAANARTQSWDYMPVCQQILERVKLVDPLSWTDCTGKQPEKIGPGVSAPSVRFKVEPQYSEEARQANLEGTVVLSIVVDESGNPRGIKVMRALGLGLDQKAIEAVQKWKFRPGMKDAHPVPVYATIEVNFRLR